MNLNFQNLMNEATRLTRAGNLHAATAAIQRALGNPRTTDAPIDDSCEVIDVEMRELPDGKRVDGEQSDMEQSGIGHLHVRQADVGTRVPTQRNDLPVGDRFIAGRYADGAGQRDYKLYIPPAAGARPLPLIVMLHGCTQDPDDFAAGTAMNKVASEQGFFVLYPAQSQRANPQRCWNWFKHNHQRRGRGEPALLAGMTRDIMTHHSIDPDRIYVAGLSAGGAMAAILGDAYPDLYAAVGVHSGLATGIASDLPSALAAMKGRGTKVTGRASGVPTIAFHGDADATVHPGNGRQVIAASVGTLTTIEDQRIQVSGGRACTRRLHRTSDGRVVAEDWLVHGAPHAWAGGSPNGSYTDERGPDATAEMIRFFLEHPRQSVG